MKTVVIPDIHGRINIAEQIIQGEKGADKFVLTGDIFDGRDELGKYDSAFGMRKTCYWLKKYLNDPRFHILAGNHDVGYLFPNNPYLRGCPGFKIEKLEAFNELIKLKEWEHQFDFVHFDQGWILCHAGFNLDNLGISEELTWELETADLEKIIAKFCDEALSAAIRGTSHPAFEKGYRMGEGRIGGPIWLDYENCLPIEGLKMIVGHTKVSYAVNKKLRRGIHYRNSGKPVERDADIWFTDNIWKSYSVIEDGKFRSVKHNYVEE